MVNKYLVSGLWFGKPIQMEVLATIPGAVWKQVDNKVRRFEIESIEFQEVAKRKSKNEFISANDNQKQKQK